VDTLRADMQNTKRMVLIDEKLLENLWRKQDTNWKKPADYKARTLLNSKLKSDLDDNTIPEDERMKLYQQNLNRFLHTSRKQPVPEPVLEPLTESIPIPKLWSSPTPVPIPKPKTRKRTVQVSPRIKRKVKKPKRFAWDTWEY
jgi:3'-phosphoadenosine 5'-phosphosulfate (PAPS) 3'-phosphatase